MSKEFLLNNLVMQSALYDLPDEEERKRSNLELSNLFINIIKFLQIDSFFEIGALSANFSSFLKKDLKNVIAFEASPQAYEIMKKNLDGFEYINLAVSDIDGIIGINVIDSNTDDLENMLGFDSILKRNNESSIKFNTVDVESTTLDSFIKNKKIDIQSSALLLDVEGAEINVLKGSAKCLNNTKAIFIKMNMIDIWENQSTINNINNTLCEKGFIPIARDFINDAQYNVVYVSSDILYSSTVDLSLQMFYSGIMGKSFNNE